MRVPKRQTYFQQFRNKFVFSALLLAPGWLVFASQTAAAQTPVTTETSTATNLGLPAKTTETTEKPEVAKTPPSPPAETLIHLGDTLDIDVLGSLEYDWRGKTDDEGFLSGLPGLDVSIFALCRTETELAAEIAAAYQKFMRSPQVVVRVLDHTARKPAVLLGAIRTPQRFRIERPVHLNELVVVAGGITDRASGEVKITRPSYYSCAAHKQTQRESQFMTVKLADLLAGKPQANPLVRTGDIVTIEEAAPVYVTGGVTAPQRILFRQGLSLSRAIASAGGLSRNGDESKITVFRRRDNQTGLQIIEADLEKIKRNPAEDVALQPYDIIDVAQSGRERNRRPPVVDNADPSQVNLDKLPLRVVN